MHFAGHASLYTMKYRMNISERKYNHKTHPHCQEHSYGLVTDIGNIPYENEIRQYLFKFHESLGVLPLTLILYWN